MNVFGFVFFKLIIAFAFAFSFIFLVSSSKISRNRAAVILKMSASVL